QGLYPRLACRGRFGRPGSAGSLSCLVQLAWVRACSCRVAVNHIPHARVNLLAPLSAAEDAVMSHARLHVVVLLVGANAAAQVLRGHGLANGANVVALTFH